MADEGLHAASAAGPSSSHNIDISTPAVVGWGAAEALADVTFDARRVDSTDHAFLKLRCNVLFKASAPMKTPLFLFIHPERIRSLQIAEPEAEETLGSEEARKKLGSETVCLRFNLTSPADLVGPKISDLTAKNRASGDILDLLRSLARQDAFQVYMRRNILSHAKLLSLCEAASSGVLKSIARQADLASLYRGKGGQVVDQPHDATEEPSGPNAPPSYDELGPSPPSAPFDAPDSSASKKRRRSSSDDAASGKVDVVDLEQMCRKIVEQQKVEMLRVVEEQQNRLYDRLLADLKPYISQELDRLEARVLDHVENRAGKQAEEQEAQLEGRLEKLHDEICDTIESRVYDVDEKIEDEFYGLRVRLEDFIKEEMADAEERIVEHLEDSATISLQFST